MTINEAPDRGEALPPPQEIDSAYPIVTRPVPQPWPPDAGRLADQAISDVLGWKWREDDTQGFQAALTGSFELRKVDGHTEATWTPRGYAIQADLGAVTGGQASLAARARSAVKDSLALLKSLRSLRTTSDPENADGFRALVRHELEEILKELESPMIRVPRVDQLFQLLLGAKPSPKNIRGHLGQLRDEFGLVGGNVNTIEEERIQTSFVTLADWVLSLQRSWQDARGSIDPFAAPSGGTPYFGPAVMALSQLLSAVAAQVEELKTALRSVGVQDEEVDVLRVPLPEPPGGSMSLGGLLRWVCGFATVEGRKLIESAGKEGVSSAFLQVADGLERYVGNLPRSDGAPSSYRAALPTGFFTFRVQRAIDELHDHLEEVVRIARSIRRNPTPPGSPPPSPRPPVPPTPSPEPPSTPAPPTPPPPTPPPPTPPLSEPAPAEPPTTGMRGPANPGTTSQGARPTTPSQARSRATSSRKRPGGTGPSATK